MESVLIDLGKKEVLKKLIYILNDEADSVQKLIFGNLKIFSDAQYYLILDSSEALKATRTEFDRVYFDFPSNVVFNKKYSSKVVGYIKNKKIYESDTVNLAFFKRENSKSIIQLHLKLK